MTDLEKMQLADIVLRNSSEARRMAFAESVNEKFAAKYAVDLWPRATADALLDLADDLISRPRDARGWTVE